MQKAEGLFHPSAFILQPYPKRVTDGTRTRDVQDHNLALYQLSYGHRRNIPTLARGTGRRIKFYTAKGRSQ